MRYILHPNLSLIRANDIQRNRKKLRFSDDVIQQIEAERLFLLANERLDAVFVVNPSIKNFLHAFSTKPRLLTEVVKEFAVTANCQTIDIQDIIQAFFDDMCERAILVPQRTVAKILRLKQQQVTALLQSGDILDNDFEILGPLSINGFTQVFLAKNQATQAKVVLKLLSLPADIPKRQRVYETKNFYQEFNLLQALGEHPNICRLLELRETIRPFAVLEHIEGESLRRVTDRNTLTIDEKKQVAHQIIDSIAALHRKKMVHGDLHLSNFLVNPLNLHTTLIDFDLANNCPPKRGEIIHEGGIHEFMPPEKINPNSFDWIDEPADYCSEVFQLGIVLYAVFFGKIPFEAVTWQELIEKIRFFDPPFIADTPTPIVALIKKCLAKQPKDRFETACVLQKTWSLCSS